MTKLCLRCGEEKEVKHFTKDARHTDTLQSQCTPCRSADNKARKQKYANEGKCQLCGLLNDRQDKTCCSKCSDKSKSNKFQLKLSIFEQYGGAKCNCCGESSNPLFLTIDHINNDGAEHRKQVNNLYYWLAANGYPEGFQVLCWNCNLGKYHNKGVCPHKQRR